jgi:hypothetical protein
MNFAAAEHGKGRVSQVLEITRLALGSGHLSPEEYYFYHLYDDSKFSWDDKKRFVGHIVQEQIKKFLVDDRWKILADDKFIFSTIFRSQGFPLAPTFATYNYHPNKRARSVPALFTRSDLKSFLFDQVEFPIFAKPVTASYGSGGIGIKAAERDPDRVILTNDESLTLNELADRLESVAGGYVIQKHMFPHRVIREICGDALATMRVVVVVGKTGPRVDRTCIRLPAGKNMSDNFMHGRTGNLGADVDIETGKLRNILRGVGVRQESLQRHPVSGKQLDGLQLPYWREVVELVTEAATLLPGFTLQGWDVAICDDGPILQEVQSGDVDLPQLAAQRGMLDDKFMRFLQRINRHWKREVILTTLDQLPRILYRHFAPKRNNAV